MSHSFFVFNDITIIFFFLGLNTEGDILLPFANDRGGTIKYKTNPTLAYQQLQVNNAINGKLTRICFYFKLICNNTYLSFITNIF